ncbi:hypothetical protein Gotur_015097 [Gossypium turneri]
MDLPFGAEILPGPCLQSSCNECALYPQSSRLCFSNGKICKPSPCFNFTILSQPLPTLPPLPVVTSRSSPLRRGLLAFVIVGSVGGFMGICNERLLVYEYMKNGVVHDYLHDKNNVVKTNSLINSWKMRIKIALDAARGIQYLHNYAVPPIIHRDIKSSNILLDMNWTTRVSDFRLSLMDPEFDHNYKLMKAVGTVSYIDPEYYGLNVLTTKSDVYGLGVVMLELLTGKRVIFKTDDNGGTPISLVNYAVLAIMAGEFVKVLDQRVGPPKLNETEAVELMAYTAMHCMNCEGKERPIIGDIVSNLERAFNVCDGSHGNISSGAFSFVSD